MKKTEDIHRIQQEVVATLGWTMDKYCHLVFDTGIEYLYRYLQDEQIADVIIQDKIFWNWWKMQWHNRDVDFMLLVPTLQGNQAIETMYRRINKVDHLLNRVYPHGEMLHNSYADMMSRLMESVVIPLTPFKGGVLTPKQALKPDFMHKKTSKKRLN